MVTLPSLEPRVGSWRQSPHRRLGRLWQTRNKQRLLEMEVMWRSQKRWRLMRRPTFALRVGIPLVSGLFWAGSSFSLASTKVKPSSGCWRITWATLFMWRPPTRTSESGIERIRAHWWFTRYCKKIVLDRVPLLEIALTYMHFWHFTVAVAHLIYYNQTTSTVLKSLPFLEPLEMFLLF